MKAFSDHAFHLRGVTGVPEELLYCLGTRLWCAKLKENYPFSFMKSICPTPRDREKRQTILCLQRASQVLGAEELLCTQIVDRRIPVQGFQRARASLALL